MFNCAMKREVGPRYSLIPRAKSSILSSKIKKIELFESKLSKLRNFECCLVRFFFCKFARINDTGQVVPPKTQIKCTLYGRQVREVSYATWEVLSA